MRCAPKVAVTLAAVTGLVLCACPARAAPYVSVSDTSWTYTGTERLSSRGLGRETAYAVGVATFYASGRLATQDGLDPRILDSIWSQRRNRLTLNITYDDIERIIESYSEDLGHDVVLEWVSRFSMSANIRPRGPAMHASMRFTGYVSVPELGLWDSRTTISGRYAGQPTGFTDITIPPGLGGMGNHVAVPEPATWSVLAVGGLAMLVRRRRL